jgi:hypothetical protein
MASRVKLLIRPPTSLLAFALSVAACNGASVTTTAYATTTTTDITTTTTSSTTYVTTFSTTTTSTSTTFDLPTTTDEPTTSTTTTSGPGLDCEALPAGPLTPELLGGGFNGSEDLGFDGAGGLALKGGEQVVIVGPDLNDTLLASGLPQTYGTRFAVNGDLLVAVPGAGKLQAISPEGVITDLVGGLEGPNGLYVDPTGVMWVTEFSGSRVVRFDPQLNKSVVYSGPDALTANGVVYDPDRGLLFFTSYGAGRLLKLVVDEQGQAQGDPVLVAALGGAALDGLALDVCGNVYAVDQANSRLYRMNLDAEAELVGQPELLAQFASNVANAQFGRGPGWDPESLYLSGNPGDLYRVVVGVEGAPIGLPQ